MPKHQEGLYLVNVELQHEGAIAGAPVLHLTLGVNAATGAITGHGEVTQALAPPHDTTIIPIVTGGIFHGGLGGDTLFVHLTGTYSVSFPPPAIGEIQKHISIAMAVDREWNGRGSFTWNGHLVAPCTAKSS